MRVRWTIAEGQGRGEDAVVPVYSFDGEARGSVELPGRIFDQPLRVDVAHRVVRWQRAKARKGLHKTKSRGEVAGSTRKVRPQKGSGRARVGNLKAPQMRGGGTAHGPVVRSHAHALPKKVRRMGLKVALSAKAAEGKLIVVDSFAGMEPKTRAMKATLERLTGDLGLAAGGDELVRMSARNLPHVEVLPQIGANVYSILRRRTLIVTKSGLEQLIARLDAPIKR
ncbi:Putative mitochondrial ribosomal protein L4 [Ostreococcus lucimarinus CCE9901]|uniref:Large ribosomal subunit protein uL4m n=1 Tax=Ostreococcus lucimarinus (strain CCE9901) TaxID=436017 RepID=A4S4R1_OSTLU|nr:Putative mitochondrial ribosomal protein L4 [Ostreococcus lucimarinus CCE9901]ABO98605.1 Putative mitochondrial ribosomal protein L4 [Ostreococcus lucimarinus CCE9901]|eukprot:XP_001420312.1 Putative mitochondrial ribosomal protein L4 [Ostreococcus lucimarinus CCE9901]